MNYLAPEVSVEEVKVEKGFATSPGKDQPQIDTFEIEEYSDGGSAW